MPQFLLRQIGDLANPIGILWIILWMLALLSLKRKNLRMAMFHSTLAAGLWVAGATPLLDHLQLQLESAHPPPDWKNPRRSELVVVLGGIADYSRNDAGSVDFASTTDRVLSALELTRLTRPKALLLMGPKSPAEEMTEGELLARWVKNWKLLPPGTELLTAPSCDNTYQEAQAAARIIREKGYKSVTLVTTATHMKRSVAVFESAGVRVHPHPCDYKSLGKNPDARPGYRIAPAPVILNAFQSTLHEHLSWHYYRLRGWIGTSPASSASASPSSNSGGTTNGPSGTQ